MPHITVDKSLDSVRLSTRKVPLAIRDQIKKEHDKHVSHGIITKVEEPTESVLNKF